MGNRHLTAKPTIPSAALLQRVVELCHERKAEDVVSLDVRELVQYMDHMVIATGRSARQNRAIAEHVVTQLKREHRILPLSKAGMDGGSWICVDLVDVVLHVFEPETRAHYDLELLWADAVPTEYAAPVGLAAAEPDPFEAVSSLETASDLEAEMIEKSQAIEEARAEDEA